MKPFSKSLPVDMMFLGARRLLQRMAKCNLEMDSVTWKAANHLGDAVRSYSMEVCSKMLDASPHVSLLSDDEIRNQCRSCNIGIVMRQDRHIFELFGEEFTAEMESRQDELNWHPEYFVAQINTESELQRVFDLSKSVRSDTYCKPRGRIPKFG